MKKAKIEVCAASVQSAINAQLADADRIELCSSLELGGITPSAATIFLAREKLDIDIFVLIRPRPGDFCYSSIEFEMIKQDILFCKKIKTQDGKKIDGIVVGFLEKNGDIDFNRTKEIVALAAPMKVTFHRAFDRATNPFIALEKIIESGAHRILTSGQQANALEGKHVLQQLILKANKRISIMPGAGINLENIQEIAETTQAKEFHLSGKSLVKSKMIFENQKVNFSQNEMSENDYFETDVEKIKEVISIINS